MSVIRFNVSFPYGSWSHLDAMVADVNRRAPRGQKLTKSKLFRSLAGSWMAKGGRL